MEIFINALDGWGILFSKIGEVKNIQYYFAVATFSLAIILYIKKLKKGKTYNVFEQNMDDKNIGDKFEEIAKKINDEKEKEEEVREVEKIRFNITELKKEEDFVYDRYKVYNRAIDEILEKDEDLYCSVKTINSLEKTAYKLDREYTFEKDDYKELVRESYFAISEISKNDNVTISKDLTELKLAKTNIEDYVTPSIYIVNSIKELTTKNEKENEDSHKMEDALDEVITKDSIYNIAELKEEYTSSVFHKSQKVDSLDFDGIYEAIRYIENIKNERTYKNVESYRRDVLEEIIAGKVDISKILEEQELELLSFKNKTIQYKDEIKYKRVSSAIEQFKKEPLRKRIIKNEIKYIGYTKNDLEEKKVIAFVGPKECGKTILATSIADEFARNKIDTTLIDTDYVNKDIYYYYNNDYTGCMSRLSDVEDVKTLGVMINKHLRVYSEHPDLVTVFDEYDIIRLIDGTKRESEAVILDISTKIEEGIFSDALRLSDIIVLVLDQKKQNLKETKQFIKTRLEKVKEVVLVITNYDESDYFDRDYFINKVFEDSNVKVKDVLKMPNANLENVKALANRAPVNNFLKGEKLTVFKNNCIKLHKDYDLKNEKIKNFWK